MTTPQRIFMVAAEPSGDLLARETVEALRALDPGLEFAAIGGEELARIGLHSPIDTSALSILGLFEGLKAWPTVVKLADAAADAIVAFAPDAVVLVDSWGFMLRVAQRVRKRAPQIRLVKLVGPQVWATRPGRAKTLAATVDQLICIHEMERPFYDGLDLPITVMGNPALGRTTRGDGAKVRDQLGVSDDLLLVLPGSRPSEIARVAPTLVAAAHRVKQDRPDTTVVFAPAASMREAFEARCGDALSWGRLAPPEIAGHDLMAAADLALACSGTVTSELAVQETPFLVGYKTGWITWFLARFFLYKPEHITLLNIAAGDREIAPEFLQTKFSADRISARALALLRDRSALTAQVAAQNKALSAMGEGQEPAASLAARAILSGASAA